MKGLRKRVVAQHFGRRQPPATARVAITHHAVPAVLAPDLCAQRVPGNPSAPRCAPLSKLAAAAQRHQYPWCACCAALQICAPSEFQGTIIGDINRRKGIIQGSEQVGGCVCVWWCVASRYVCLCVVGWGGGGEQVGGCGGGGGAWLSWVGWWVFRGFTFKGRVVLKTGKRSPP